MNDYTCTCSCGCKNPVDDDVCHNCRIGGQNVGAKISNTTEKELEKLGYDVEEVIILLQRNLSPENS